MPLVGFESSPEHPETREQFPLFQGSGEIEAARLAFEQGEIVKGVVVLLR